MPTLHWIGKEKVVNHHRDVPFKVLEHQYSFDVDGGVQTCKGRWGNKIIHGDNLEALKSLIPEYEGRIKCVYIDPPYNTGNEGWIYNDNVNDPKIKKWIQEVVGKEGEDLSRHDKWLCMMYPRLKLIHKLLSSDGFIAISIDDNEIFNLGLVLNEIFGASKRLACIPVKAEPSGGKGKDALRIGHEYILIYCKGTKDGLKLESKEVSGVVLNDKFGTYIKGRELSKWGSESLRQDREEMWFPLYAPDGTEVLPYRNDGKEGRWRWGKKNKAITDILKNPEYAHWEKRKFDEGIVVNGDSERWFPFEKIRKKIKEFGWNTWLDTVGFNSEGTKQIKEIFSDKIFDTPKPSSLIEWVVNLMKDTDGIVLDSFAGSGTTAHAIINLNKEGGNRKFILIEMEDYAETITAERVKSVINGYQNNLPVDSGFDFYTLGAQLFLDNGELNEEVELVKIREYIYFSETKQNLQGGDQKTDHSSYLGSFNRTAYYFHYLKNELTTLNMQFLAQIQTRSEQYVIYADNCLLDANFMLKKNILFKKIPRDISRF
ncbi:MAG: site-specific DNA-methyltransferase [Daejeonella sp.]